MKSSKQQGPKQVGYQRNLNHFEYCRHKQVQTSYVGLDSGCSRHMTGDRALLSNVVEKAGPIVTFGDDSKGFTTGYGNLEIRNVIIENISIVEGLKHNLLSISQFCDKGFDVSFKKERCLISNRKMKSLLFKE